MIPETPKKRMMPLRIIRTTDTNIYTSYSKVNLNAFQKWAYDNDKLDWVEDTEVNGEHKQTSGIYTWDDYFYLLETDEEIRKDLAEYILQEGRGKTNVKLNYCLKSLL